MTHAIGMLDFFVLEAGEYLERLDALAQAPAAGAWPGAEEFVRIVRAFRGGALMAGQTAIARAAQGLEVASRAVRDGRIAWDERVRGDVVRAVDDVTVLVRRVRTPAAGDAARAGALGAALEQLAGRPAAAARTAGAGGGLDAGGRAFVAREASAIASALDRAARDLATDPSSRTALAGVTPAMSALRGVAVLNDLPPLADVLVGVEGAVKEVFATSGCVGPDVPALFDAGAKTLARAAREVVDLGRPSAESEEVAAFASLLLRAFAKGGAVVEIEALKYDGDATPVAQAGMPPAPMSRTEVVSQGEFLAAAAGGLEHAASPVLRDLRLFGMAASLRPLAGATGSPLAVAFGRFADAGRAAIDRGAASANAAAFAELIAGAADTLRASRAGDETEPAEQLDLVTGRLEQLESTAAPPEAPAAVPAPEEVAVPEAAAGAEAGLAGAYTVLARLSAAHGTGGAPLEQLLAGGLAEAEMPLASAAEAGVVPIEALAPDGDVVPIESLAPDAEAVVDIETLLYRGGDALRRALALQPQLDARLAAEGPGGPGVAALLHEVFDLIELGLGAAR